MGPAKKGYVEKEKYRNFHIPYNLEVTVQKKKVPGDKRVKKVYTK